MPEAVIVTENGNMGSNLARGVVLCNDLIIHRLVVIFVNGVLLKVPDNIGIVRAFS